MSNFCIKNGQVLRVSTAHPYLTSLELCSPSASLYPISRGSLAWLLVFEYEVPRVTCLSRSWFVYAPSNS